MKNKIFLLLILLVAGIQYTIAQQSHLTANDVKEIRYWQDMTKMGNNDILIDTMVYYGNDRAGFEYSNAQCVSFHCRDTDSLIYSLLPSLFTAEKDWTLGKSYIRKMDARKINFKGIQSEVFKVYVSDLNNKSSGYGDYSLVMKDFGVVCRWNVSGEFFQLIRIDALRGGDAKQEESIDLLPLFDQIYASGIFN
ncbi:MAG: hypothetical protein IPL35_10685 [Sphingobacteriales bacterium]|nr:hypothetical protein [Sphingobacteriales bacterium]